MGEALTGAFTTAVGTIKTDVTTMISTALPAGLAIMGIGLAVRALLFKVSALQLPHAPLALFKQQHTFVLSINIKNQSNIKKYTIVKIK